MSSSNPRHTIYPASVVAASRDQVSASLGNETVLLSMESAMYYGIDSVGSRIWELLQEPIRVSQIRDVITSEYDVDAERCEADVIAFLQRLLASGLIEVRGDF